MTGSIHLLVRIGAPQPLLADPAVEILTHKLAPGAVAGFELAEHAGLQAGGLRGFGIRALIKRHQIVLQGRHHHRGTPAGQQRVVDPSFRPFPVADAPPVLELGGDLHRHAGAGEDPAHFLVLVGAGAHIDPVRLEADEARDRQAAHRAGGHIAGRMGRGHRHGHNCGGKRRAAQAANRGCKALCCHCHLVGKRTDFDPTRANRECGRARLKRAERRPKLRWAAGRRGKTDMPKTKKPLVVVTRKLPDSVELRMRELFDARFNPDDKPMTHAQLAEAVKTADVLVPTVTDRIDASVLSKSGEQLKLIANFGNGVDNIDVVTAVQRGITVTNTPGVLTEDTADMTMALVLAVPRRLVEGSAVLTADTEWTGWTPTWMLGHRIWGKRLGIIGMGRIGQAVARRARAFGLQIHYNNRRRVAPKIEEELDATYWESLDQMLARMDIISVNCPHTPATYHLLSARRLKLLRPEAFIVNTSRGEVIDENALARLIESGDIAGAGLDVFEHEPAVNPKLVKLARAGKVVLLPHMGSATLEGRVDMGEKVIINIKTFMDGHRPPDRVLPSML